MYITLLTMRDQIKRCDLANVAQKLPLQVLGQVLHTFKRNGKLKRIHEIGRVVLLLNITKTLALSKHDLAHQHFNVCAAITMHF
jgi:hypothetical protein